MAADTTAAAATTMTTTHSAGPIREDCWTQEATSTLVDAWGRRYLELNRGNLRQKDWQDVADAVNSVHGHLKKSRRTDVQCKNRIDTLKKKYKAEKSRVSSSLAPSSPWLFFSRLDALIGPSASKKPSPTVSTPVALPLPHRKSSAPALPQKRHSSPAAALPADDAYFRRNYSAVAAAAAAAPGDSEEDDDWEDSRSGGGEEEEEEEEGQEGGRRDSEAQGIRRLARAIARFGEIYERVEADKQRQMVELEKQRMQFAKDLEFQRMQMFMDTQVQLEKIKRSKRSGSNGDDMYS